MAASGKKGKKPKGKTFALTDFLADGATGAASPVIRNKAWADEVDNDEDVYDMSGSRNKQPVVLPTAPRATRNLNVDDENIPKNPPYNAYISNLQYDVAEEEIEEFFKDMKIVNVRLPRDDRGSGRLKGFGYVEFDSREALIAALNIGDTTIKGRRMRIEVAAASEGERRGGMGGRSGREMGYDLRGGDRGDRDGPDRTLGDWRSGPREDPPNDRPTNNRDNTEGRPSDRGPFTRDNMDRSFNREGGDRGAFTRDNMDRSFNREGGDRGAFTRDNMDRSFNREGGDRGAFTRENMDRSFNREGGDRGAFTRDNMDRSFNREGGDRGGFTRDNMDRGAFTRENMDRSFNREGGGDRADRGAFTRDNMDAVYQGRREGGPGFRSGSDREATNAAGDRLESETNGSVGGGSGAVAAVSERPRLQLTQRTIPAPNDAASTPPAPAAATAAIFGGAKPVDTAARERQIEERLAKLNQPPAPRTESGGVNSGAEEGKQESPEGGWPRRGGAPPPSNPASPPGSHTGSNESNGQDAGRRPAAYSGAAGGAVAGGGGRGGARGGPPSADAPPRMPRLVDQASPNFAVANKFGLLPAEGDAANESD